MKDLCPTVRNICPACQCYFQRLFSFLKETLKMINYIVVSNEEDSFPFVLVTEAVVRV